MENKKDIKEIDIINAFMDYVLEHNKYPNSVYAFSKANDFEEAIFYKYYTSFEALEKGIFLAFFKNAIEMLEKSEDYKMFDARNKLLGFYYTFFEILTANRSYVKFATDKFSKDLRKFKVLAELKKAYTNYIDELEIQTLDLKQEHLEKFKNQSLKESAWVQLLLTMKFWLEDTSKEFDKTDIFIEKSVNTTFDLLDMSPVKSLFDLAKFLYKEKFQMN